MGASGMVSKSDCLDTDEVSVLLPSGPLRIYTSDEDGAASAAGGGEDVPGSPRSLISILLKASTSIDAFPGLVIACGGVGSTSVSGCSIVSNVFEKGFAGAR